MKTQINMNDLIAWIEAQSYPEARLRVGDRPHKGILVIEDRGGRDERVFVRDTGRKYGQYALILPAELDRLEIKDGHRYKPASDVVPRTQESIDADRRQREEERDMRYSGRVEGVSLAKVGEVVERVERHAAAAADDLYRALDSLIERATEMRDELAEGTVRYREAREEWVDVFEGTGYFENDRAPRYNEEGVREFPHVGSVLANTFNGEAEKALAALGAYTRLREEHNRWQWIIHNAQEES